MLEELDLEEGHELEFEFDMVDGFIVWLTGLSQAGKSTVADFLEDILLNTLGMDTQVLDNDDVKEKLCKELGIYKEDCDLNVERIAYVANLLAMHGTAVIVAIISPYKEAREKIKNYRTIEVFCDCTTKELKSRGCEPCVKTDPYEPPLNPDVHLHTDKESPQESVMKIIHKLSEMYDYIDEDAIKEAKEALGV